jgi:hypothetical protein
MVDIIVPLVRIMLLVGFKFFSKAQVAPPRQQGLLVNMHASHPLPVHAYIVIKIIITCKLSYRLRVIYFPSTVTLARGLKTGH